MRLAHCRRAITPKDAGHGKTGSRSVIGPALPAGGAWLDAAPKPPCPPSPPYPARASADHGTTRADVVRASQRRAQSAPLHELGRRERVRLARPFRALGRHCTQPPDNVVDAARRGRRFRHGRHGAAKPQMALQPPHREASKKRSWQKQKEKNKPALSPLFSKLQMTSFERDYVALLSAWSGDDWDRRLLSPVRAERCSSPPANRPAAVSACMGQILQLQRADPSRIGGPQVGDRANGALRALPTRARQEVMQPLNGNDLRFNQPGLPATSEKPTQQRSGALRGRNTFESFRSGRRHEQPEQDHGRAKAWQRCGAQDASWFELAGSFLRDRIVRFAAEKFAQWKLAAAERRRRHRRPTGWQMGDAFDPTLSLWTTCSQDTFAEVTGRAANGWRKEAVYSPIPSSRERTLVSIAPKMFLDAHAPFASNAESQVRCVGPACGRAKSCQPSECASGHSSLSHSGAAVEDILAELERERARRAQLEGVVDALWQQMLTIEHARKSLRASDSN